VVLTKTHVAALRTWSTVSHPPPRTLETCGAKAGEDTSTEGRRTVDDDLALGHHHDPVGGLGDELDVVGGEQDGHPVVGQFAEHPGQRRLGG
jgi:hypothetical protein